MRSRCSCHAPARGAPRCRWTRRGCACATRCRQGVSGCLTLPGCCSSFRGCGGCCTASVPHWSTRATTTCPSLWPGSCGPCPTHRSFPSTTGGSRTRRRCSATRAGSMPPRTASSCGTRGSRHGYAPWFRASPASSPSMAYPPNACSSQATPPTPSAFIPGDATPRSRRPVCHWRGCMPGSSDIWPDGRVCTLPSKP